MLFLPSSVPAFNSLSTDLMLFHFMLCFPLKQCHLTYGHIVIFFMLQVFDYFVDGESHEFVHWSDAVPPYSMPPHEGITPDAFVHTVTIEVS